jgi:hypothetical protein
MKSNRIAIAALLLWAFTIAVFAWFFVRGITTEGTDGRTAVVLNAGERDFVLSEMRGLLAALHEILEGANRGDMKRIAESSRAVGTAGAADENPLLMAKLPLAFKTLGMGVHRDMDEIADAADRGRPVPELLKMASNVLAKCVACHASWQIKTGNQIQ